MMFALVSFFSILVILASFGILLYRAYSDWFIDGLDMEFTETDLDELYDKRK